MRVIFRSLREGTISGVTIVCESLLSTSFSLRFSLVGVESFNVIIYDIPTLQ